RRVPVPGARVAVAIASGRATRAHLRAYSALRLRVPGLQRAVEKRPMRVDRSAFLHGPIAGTLLGLAWPILVVLALQTFVGVAETWFVSFLGTGAVAGVTLVFRVFVRMTTLSNGGIGGGVSSAVARAIGAGRMGDA